MEFRCVGFFRYTSSIPRAGTKRGMMLRDRVRVLDSSGPPLSLTYLDSSSQMEMEFLMLVLSRKVGEEIIINGNVRVRIVQIDGGKVRIGFVAPDDVTIDRQEIHDKKRVEFAAIPAIGVVGAVPLGLLAVAL